MIRESLRIENNGEVIITQIKDKEKEIFKIEESSDLKYLGKKDTSIEKNIMKTENKNSPPKNVLKTAINPTTSIILKPLDLSEEIQYADKTVNISGKKHIYPQTE